ncbi:SCO family protein [Hymenobacter sp. BT730]|uniref:SCO family protein n=1 Tax=Hymenobacter sp. BT730 TaxID=3063332 RepID=UPI0026E0AFCD|nr:SCO family protein [Hymenobacter sp. BT730]
MIHPFFRRVLLALSGTLLLASCSDNKQQATTLPYIGEHDVRARTDGGPADTIYATIPRFTLTNQEGKTVTDSTLAGKVYVTDFFFATCPSICPKMQSEMLRVYEKYKNNPRVAFLSHTIDPAHDSIPVLRDYAERLGVTNASQWQFVTAPHDTIFALARAYMTGAEADKKAAGGFAHNGTFALVDGQRHVRGLYDGMNPQEVDRLLREMPLLLAEESAKQSKP